MNDEMLMNNYLLLLKSTVEVYIHGTLESSNDDVRSLLKTCLDNTISCQGNTYDEMVDYGWYKVTNLETDKIQQTLDKLQKCN
jgi:spore coat protein CotF